MSSLSNDYNPFGLDTFYVTDPEKISPLFHMSAFPQPLEIKKSEFARLTLEEKAAYANGIARGSLQETWLREMMYTNASDVLCFSKSDVGLFAYAYLKTKNEMYLETVRVWCDRHSSSDDLF